MSEFKWAFGDKANVKEPIEGLKEDGWKYADIPTASNFNWLFNKIAGLLKEDSENINALGDKEKKIREGLRDYQGRTDHLENMRIINEGALRQICRYLYFLEDELRKSIPNIRFSALPFSEEEERRPHEN